MLGNITVKLDTSFSSTVRNVTRSVDLTADNRRDVLMDVLKILESDIDEELRIYGGKEGKKLSFGMCYDFVFVDKDLGKEIMFNDQSIKGKV